MRAALSSWNRARCPASFAALLLALGLFAPTPARATSLDFGISLGDLVGGDSFESDDGLLTFSGFSASVEGVGIEDLDEYRVVPIDNGFKLWAPQFVHSDDFAKLNLEYDVIADDGFEIKGMDLAYWGLAVGSDAEAGAMATVFDSGLNEVGSLSATKSGRHFDWSFVHDSVEFGPLTELSVSEMVKVRAGGKHCFLHSCGHDKWWTFASFAKGSKVIHTFDVMPIIPEPSTAVMLGGGLLGLAAIGRRLHSSA